MARSRIDAEGHGDVVHFLRGEDFAGIDLPRVQDLAAQRHDGLELAIARLLRRTARRVAFDEEQLRATEILTRAVGELAGKRRAARQLLPLDLLPLTQANHRLL